MNHLKETFFRVIERDKEELFQILSDLIKINSENFGTYGNETECAEYIGKWFGKIGYEADIYSPLEIKGIENHPDYLPGRNLENRKNCTVLIPGKSHEKTLMLAAHHDTVEIGNPDYWEFDPLCGEIKDGKIFGRGACDDKYGCAISMFLIKKMKELGIVLDYDLIFSAYCDEEHGGSNGALATCLRYPCDDCLNIDGLEGELWDTGCGGGGVLFEVNSKKSENDCFKVLKGLNLLVSELEKFRNRRKEELEANSRFKGTDVVKNATRIMTFSVGETGGINMDKGNLVITFYTDKAKEEINNEFNTICSAVANEFERIGLNPLAIRMKTRFFNYVKGDDKNYVAEKLCELGDELGMPMKRCGACLSDLPMFSLYGSPRSTMFGIGGAFDKKGGAHQRNESVDCDKLVKATKLVAGFMVQYQHLKGK